MTINRLEVAVIIPSYGRPGRLSECLAALASQEGGPYRTYVVDDGSPEPLEAVCAPYGWVRCLRQSNAGPAAARNAGAAAARADGAAFFCFTDDDCRPQPGWVRALAAAHGGDRTRLVGGHVTNALADNPYAEASQSLNDFLLDYFRTRDGRVDFFTSNNFGCDGESYLSMGGFDPAFPLAAAEDRDFCRRWSDAVGPLVHAPGAIVDHVHALTFARFWRQHANYGRGAYHLHRAMASRGDKRNRFEAARFYAELVFHPLRGQGPGRIGRTALMGLSQMAMAAGYLGERRSTK